MADLEIRQNARNANVLKEDLRISNKPKVLDFTTMKIRRLSTRRVYRNHRIFFNCGFDMASPAQPVMLF